MPDSLGGPALPIKLSNKKAPTKGGVGAKNALRGLRHPAQGGEAGDDTDTVRL